MSNDRHAAHSELDTMRHSCAHVMAAAIQSIWPDAQFGVGPTIDNGFYYDVLLTTPLVEADLAKIETAMRKLRKKKHRFVKHDLPITEAISRMETYIVII